MIPTILDPNYKMEFLSKNLRDIYTKWLIDEMCELEPNFMEPIQPVIEPIEHSQNDHVSNLLDEFIQVQLQKYFLSKYYFKG